MFRNRFASRLKKLRNEAGLSQADLASKIGSSTNAVGMYETGKRMPREDVLEKIQAYFNVSFDYLFGVSDDPKPGIEKALPIYETKLQHPRGFTNTGETVLFREGDFALRVAPPISKMLYPVYLEGDIIIVKRAAYIKGKLSVVRKDGEIFTGKVNRDAKNIIMTSLNPSQAETRLLKEEAEIIGVVIGMVRLVQW